MILVIAGAVLAALAAFSVWCAADRLWHALAVIVLATLLFPLTAASRLTGDVARHLPAGTFSDGFEGKDQVVIASVAASFLFAVVLAACVWAGGKLAWRSLRRSSK